MLRFGLILSFCGLFLISPSASASRPIYAADAFFDFGSAMPKAHSKEKLDLLVCRLGERPLEDLIAVGHAGKHEPRAQQLSEARALAVKHYLTAQGLPAHRIQAVGKGADQPVACKDCPEKWKNRRVEIEALIVLRGTPPGPCDPPWQKAFLSLPIPEALQAAHQRFATDPFNRQAPWLVALQQNRPDLFQALAAAPEARQLSTVQRREIYAEAISKPQAHWLLELLNHRVIRLMDFDDPGKPLHQAACYWSEEREAKLRILLAWGAKPSRATPPTSNTTDTALSCTIERGDLVSAQRLLDAGARLDELPDIIPLVGISREKLDFLIKAGADPTAVIQVRDRRRSIYARTLFHTYRLQNPADVPMLIALGLDINAEDDLGHNPLYRALGYASTEVLDALVKHGAQWDDSSSVELLSNVLPYNIPGAVWAVQHGASLGDDNRLLMRAARQGDAALPLIEAILQRGVSPNQTVKEFGKSTVLMQAVSAYSPKVVELLLRSGADPLATSDKGLTALELAKQLSETAPMPTISGFPARPGDQAPLDPKLQQAKARIIELLERAQNLPG